MSDIKYGDVDLLPDDVEQMGAILKDAFSKPPIWTITLTEEKNEVHGKGPVENLRVIEFSEYEKLAQEFDRIKYRLDFWERSHE